MLLLNVDIPYSSETIKAAVISGGTGDVVHAYMIDVTAKKSYSNNRASSYIRRTFT
jgi:hypothetical protein